MRLIGLAGKARSGKDTVAGMIQELVPGTRTLAFAEPMKRFLKEIFDWDERHVSGALKEVGDPRYIKDAAGLHTGTCCATRMKEKPESDWSDCPGLPAPIFLTPRYAMQRLGTEFGRTCYPNVWVEYAMRQAQRMFADRFDPVAADDNAYGLVCRNCTLMKHMHGADGKCHRDVPPLVVITDCRVVNEAEAIRDAGGVVWKIDRPGAGATGGIAKHASEMEMDSEEFFSFVTARVQNDKGLPELRAHVEALVALQQLDWKGD